MQCMKDKEFWTQANRDTVITRVVVEELPDGSLKRPPARFLECPSETMLRRAVTSGDPIWVLQVFYQTGLAQEARFRKFFISSEEAYAESENFPVGKKIQTILGVPDERQADETFNPNALSPETQLSVFGRGEPPYQLVFESLVGAGVFTASYDLTETVSSWLGTSGQSFLEKRFGENWKDVAVLEYCSKHFHPTSLANVAARVLVAESVARFKFDAGYASRELLELFDGAEKLALRSLNTKKKAGSSGGRASSARRLANLEILMQQIEQLSGAVGLISEERIVEQALEKSVAKQKGFPKSHKTHADYGTALRSEEPFKSRYEAVLKKNA